MLNSCSWKSLNDNSVASMNIYRRSVLYQARDLPTSSSDPSVSREIFSDESFKFLAESIILKRQAVLAGYKVLQGSSESWPSIINQRRQLLRYSPELEPGRCR